MAGEGHESFRYVPDINRGPLDAKYDEFARDVLDSSIEERAKGVRRTIIDLMRVPVNAKDDEIIEWASRWLDIPIEYLNGTGTTEASKHRTAAVYRTLNGALQEAQEYLTSLHAERYIPRDRKALTVTNRQDLLHLVRETVAFKAEGDRARPEQVKYCALIRAAIAAVEVEKHEVSNLMSESRYIARELSLVSKKGEPGLLQYMITDQRGKVEKAANGAQPFTLAVRSDSKVEDSKAILGELWWRGKSRRQIMTKMLSRPEASAESALKDGIGFRLMVDHSDMAQVAKNAAVWLTKRFGATELSFINENLYPPKEWDEMQKKLSHPDIKRVRFERKKPNTTSAGTFVTLKITGTLSVPVAGQKNNSLVRRPFELQVVARENKNDKKGLNHHIYDVMKEVSVMTRLVGGCADTIFDTYVKEAAQRSKFTEEHIREQLIESGRLVHHHGMVVDPSVWKEWEEVGVPGAAGEFGKQIETKTAHMRQKKKRA